MIPTNSELAESKTHIEKVMMDLDPQKSMEEHRKYLAGYIDAMADLNEISEETREILYVEYAF